jgi:hypothetical protein
MTRKPREGDCVRCGSEGSVIVRDYAVTMSDVYRAYLCLDCRNDWDAYITSHPVRIAKTKNIDDMNMAFAMTCGDGIDRTGQMVRLRDEEQDIARQVRAVAEAWVQQSITRSQPANT